MKITAEFPSPRHMDRSPVLERGVPRENAALRCLAVACLAWGLVMVPSTGPPAAWAETPSVMDEVGPRVVKIFGAGGLKNLYAYGTGFLVTGNGHIVTVWSHVLDDQSVSVVLHNGRRFEAKVLGAEPDLDLAVIKIDAEDLPHFSLDQADTAGPGTPVLAFSNMFKVATGDEPVSVMHGVIAARTHLTARRGTYESPYTGPVYVVDAVTNNPGAGGGVLTTREGRLLGMIGKELRNAHSNTWINYAVPIGELRDKIEAIIAGRSLPSRAPREDERLANYTPLDFGLVMVPDVVFRTPAYVERVVPGSAAESAGLKTNDLVVFANDELVASCRVFRRAVGALEAGDVLRLVVRRGNLLVNVELTAEAKPEEAARPARKGTGE